MSIVDYSAMSVAQSKGVSKVNNTHSFEWFLKIMDKTIKKN